MRRKDVLVGIAMAAGTLAGAPTSAFGAVTDSGNGFTASVPNLGKPLHPPAHGVVQVAFVIGPDLVAIDLFGPQAAFYDATMYGANMNLYTVGESTKPVDVNGMKARPQYSFENAPQPNVLVVPMQKNLPATIAYIRKAAARADVTMSVCTGAFLVAQAGLFDGGRATTHHGGYDDFEKMYPSVKLIRGPRYVEDRNVCSSGGESSGIDLALRVVERYYGRTAANQAAYNMEYRRSRRPQSANDV